MNCLDIMNALGYSCRQVRDGVIKIETPFSYHGDGQLIDLYVREKDGEFHFSDAANTVRLLSTHNVSITTKRLGSLAQAVEFEGVAISDRGELSISAPSTQVTLAIAGLISACLGVSHQIKHWQDKAAPISFTDKVARYLETRFRSIERNVEVSGMSGHKYAVPIVIRSERQIAYFQTITQKHGKISWPDVQKSVGLMTDIKLATDDSGSIKRYTIIDDNEGPVVAQAETLLSTCSSVLPFSRHDDWLNNIAA